MECGLTCFEAVEGGRSVNESVVVEVELVSLAVLALGAVIWEAKKLACSSRPRAKQRAVSTWDGWKDKGKGPRHFWVDEGAG